MNSLQHLCAIFHHHLEPGYYKIKVKKQEKINANIIANHVAMACETNAGPLSKTTYKAVASGLRKALQKLLHCCSH